MAEPGVAGGGGVVYSKFLDVKIFLGICPQTPVETPTSGACFSPPPPLSPNWVFIPPDNPGEKSLFECAPPPPPRRKKTHAHKSIQATKKNNCNNNKIATIFLPRKILLASPSFFFSFFFQFGFWPLSHSLWAQMCTPSQRGNSWTLFHGICWSSLSCPPHII